MKTSLPPDRLADYVTTLIDTHAPDGGRHDVARAVRLALERADHCYRRVALRGYRTADGESVFNHLHGDQFAQFLYWVSHVAWSNLEDIDLAQKVCLLNRSRSALLVMYDTVLPEYFLIPHTVGTVIGKGTYGNYTVFCQNVQIANDIITTLTVGEGVIFYPGAFAVGTGSIGDGSVITANTTLSYVDVPPNTMVRGISPNLEMWPRKRDLLSRFFVSPFPASEGPAS